MIRSMTAFASGERNTPWGNLSCELRSVNHRFLEISPRLSDELRNLEPALRERINARLHRGKVDISMRLRPLDGGSQLAINQTVVDQLTELAQALQTRLPNMQVEFTRLLQLPNVLQTAQPDPVGLQTEAFILLEEVLTEFIAAREREGSKLAEVIQERVNLVAHIAAEVTVLIPNIRDGQRNKLAARMADLAYPVEQGRAEQELVLWLQKLDVDEELDRLSSHIKEIRRILKQPEPAGRRLDFLMQEFNREANTLGAKSVDSRTSNAAVELKVLIDQIREQVQNIE